MPYRPYLTLYLINYATWNWKLRRGRSVAERRERARAIPQPITRIYLSCRRTSGKPQGEILKKSEGVGLLVNQDAPAQQQSSLSRCCWLTCQIIERYKRCYPPLREGPISIDYGRCRIKCVLDKVFISKYGNILPKKKIMANGST